MKQIFTLAGVICLCQLLSLRSNAQDLPGFTPNTQTAPAGTLVIAMDNVNQACNTPTNGTYLFNLKSYGLAIFLLDVRYQLQWAIKTGKSHDGIDFTATAERITPSYSSSQSRDFKAGPLLIFPADTSGAAYAISVFNSLLPDSCKVKVYRLTTSVNVDVRYTLNRPPKAALLNDSCDIHRNFMEMASVPNMNYDCLPNAYGLKLGCYTIATDPHTMASDLTAWDADSIYNFVMAGGNFLAECEGVKTFELLKKFQSVTGVIPSLTGGSFQNFNNNTYYDNADMAYGQINGTYSPWTRGAVKVWRYSSANTNNFYSVLSCKRNSTDNLHYAATVSKMTADTGSLVFYLGNHEYYTHDCHTCVAGNTINESEINGIRFYLNAVLIPSKFQKCVNVFDIPLPVRMGDFTVNKRVDGAAVLRWNSLTEKDNIGYYIEHSVDGRTFTVVGHVPAKGDTDFGYDYDFLHREVNRGYNYYRLRMLSNNGENTYSETRRIVVGSQNQVLNIYPNPAVGYTYLQLDARDNEMIKVSVFDLSGRQVSNQQVTVKGQKAELNIDDISRGMYSLIVHRDNGEQLRGKLLVAF